MGSQRQGVELANSFVDFLVNLLAAHLRQNDDTMGLMEHTEDLRAVRSGHHPGSAWQFLSARGL